MKSLIRYRSTGFTLIEIMLVLVVMAVMASLLVLSISSNPAKELEREAKRLQAVLEMAAEEAVMQGVELSLALVDHPEDNTTGYQFLLFDIDSQRWQPLENKPFNYYPLKNAINIDIHLSDEEQTPIYQQRIAAMQKLGSGQGFVPSLLLLSSGEMTPFEIRFIHPQMSDEAILISDGLSGVELR